MTNNNDIRRQMFEHNGMVFNVFDFLSVKARATSAENDQRKLLEGIFSIENVTNQQLYGNEISFSVWSDKPPKVSKRSTKGKWYQTKIYLDEKNIDSIIEILKQIKAKTTAVDPRAIEEYGEL